MERRLNRIPKAVSLETPDRVLVVLEYAGFTASATQAPMFEFIRSRAAATQTMIHAYELVGGGDAISYGSPQAAAGLHSGWHPLRPLDLPLEWAQSCVLGSNRSAMPVPLHPRHFQTPVPKRYRW